MYTVDRNIGVAYYGFSFSENYLLEKKKVEYLHNSKVQASPLLSLWIGLHLFYSSKGDKKPKSPIAVVILHSTIEDFLYVGYFSY